MLKRHYGWVALSCRTLTKAGRASGRHSPELGLAIETTISESELVRRLELLQQTVDGMRTLVSGLLAQLEWDDDLSGELRRVLVLLEAIARPF